jgi:predicted nucleic acid-binding protein
VIVVDTNVLAYLLIEGDRSTEAQALYARDADWRSEAFLLVEFSNILATYERSKALSTASAFELLASAERVVAGLVNLPHSRALQLASRFGVSAYDARFLGAAQTLGAKLVTEDERLRKAAPSLTQSLSEALA